MPTSSTPRTPRTPRAPRAPVPPAPRATPAPTPDPDESYVVFHLPKRVPMALLFTFIIQIVVVVWAVSGFYYSQKEMQNQLSENITRFTTKMNELKSTIYTRNEALLKFEEVRQENFRQDQELRDLREKVYRNGK